MLPAELPLRLVTFWDVSLDTLDAEQHAWFIIRRVLEIGSLEEIRAINRWYGRERIKVLLLAHPPLPGKAGSFAALAYGLGDESIPS